MNADANDRRRVVVENTVDEVADFVAELVESVICESVEQRGRCRLALAGGTTPHALYRRMAHKALKRDVPWRRCDVFFGDERDVPQDNVESNYGMTQRTLLDHVPVQPRCVYPMPADAKDLSAAAEDYERALRQVVPAGADGTPEFDLILLGMGADGHTASLFPHTDAVDERQKLVVSHLVPVLGRRRMTFTFALINAARCVILLVSGEDKAEAVATLLLGGDVPALELPAAAVDPAHGQYIVVLDAAAARAWSARSE